MTGTAMAALAALPPAAGELRATAFGKLRIAVVSNARGLADAVGSTARDAAELIGAMVNAGLVEVDEGCVADAAGLSSRPTDHALVLDGVNLHTWCAVDVLGIPAVLGADALARSVCPWCGSTIEVAFVAGLPSGTAALRAWFPHLACSNVRAEFWPQANLFCNDEHLAAWHAAAGDPTGESLGMAELVAFGHMAWGDLADPPPTTLARKARP